MRLCLCPSWICMNSTVRFQLASHLWVSEEVNDGLCQIMQELISMSAPMALSVADRLESQML